MAFSALAAAALAVVAAAGGAAGQRPSCTYAGGALSVCATQTAGDYTCCDTEGGMQYWWDANVATTGQQIWGAAAPAAVQTLSLGFTFYYYGYPYTEVTVSTFGWFALGRTTASPSSYPSSFPSTSNAHGAVGVFRCGITSNVRFAYVTRGGQSGLVVHFAGSYNSNPTAFVSQFSLWNETNHVEVHYQSAVASPVDIGFESISEAFGIQWRDSASSSAMTTESWSILPPMRTPPNPAYSCSYSMGALSACANAANVLQTSGMTCCDTEGGVPYLWNDTLTDGGTVVFTDQSTPTTQILQLPADTPFYDMYYDRILVSSQGWFNFGTHLSSASYPSSFPSTSNNQGAIGVASLSYCASLKYLVVTHPVSGQPGLLLEWVGEYNSNDFDTGNRVQVGIYADGLISFNYQMTTSHTTNVGWENVAETMGYSWLFGTQQLYRQSLDIIPDPVPAATAFDNTCNYASLALSPCAGTGNPGAVATASGGYLCCDEEGGMDYRWLDFRTLSPTTVFATPASAAASTIPLGFSMPWYDRCYSSVTLTTRGYIGFGQQALSSYPSSFPSTNNAAGLVAVFSMSETNNVQVVSVTHPVRNVSGIVVQQTGRYNSNSAPAASRTQTHLYEDGTVEIYYQGTSADFRVVGWESEDEQNGFEYASGSTISYYRKPLAIYPASPNAACTSSTSGTTATTDAGSTSNSMTTVRPTGTTFPPPNNVSDATATGPSLAAVAAATAAVAAAGRV